MIFYSFVQKNDLFVFKFFRKKFQLKTWRFFREPNFGGFQRSRHFGDWNHQQVKVTVKLLQNAFFFSVSGMSRKAFPAPLYALLSSKGNNSGSPKHFYWSIWTTGKPRTFDCFQIFLIKFFWIFFFSLDFFSKKNSFNKSVHLHVRFLPK